MFYKESLCYTAPLMYSFSIAISTTIFANIIHDGGHALEKT